MGLAICVRMQCGFIRSCIYLIVSEDMPSSIRVVVEIDRAVWISVHFGTGSMSVLFPKCCRALGNWNILQVVGHLCFYSLRSPWI